MPRLPRFTFDLHKRLLTSYLLLLMVTIGVIAAALFVLIGNRSAPPEPTYARLAALTQGLNFLDYITEIPRDPNLRFLQDRVHELLDAFAETRNVRTLNVRLSGDGPRVLYDSARRFQPGDMIQLRGESYRNENLARILARGSEQVFGSFTDPEGGEWLFGGVMFGQQRSRPDRSAFEDVWILTEPRPTVSLQETLAVFSSALAPPLLQAGVVGIAVALILAALISRNIAQPLQRVAKAATAMARGDYSARVPVSGAPELRSLADSFNQMTAEVLAANTAQREFLGNVSHDLKTPLTSIQGYAQAIVDGAAADPQEAAQIIYEEASRLNRMVVELTDLERLRAGKLSMRRDAIDMTQLCEAVAQRLQVLAGSQGISLETSTVATPAVIGDGDRLAQVLMNLISNALKFTPAGGTVRVEAEPAVRGVEVSVRDTGRGIARSDYERVFERFYQVDKSRGPGRGTGLGLAIVQEIVEAHGGRINVESGGLGRGSVFRVWLPAVERKGFAVN